MHNRLWNLPVLLSTTDEKAGGPVKNAGGPIKLHCVIMFAKQLPKCIFSPLKCDKFSQCLTWHGQFSAKRSQKSPLAKGCRLWVQNVMYFVSLALQYCKQYYVIFDKVTARLLGIRTILLYFLGIRMILLYSTLVYIFHEKCSGLS